MSRWQCYGSGSSTVIVLPHGISSARRSPLPAWPLSCSDHGRSDLLIPEKHRRALKFAGFPAGSARARFLGMLRAESASYALYLKAGIDMTTSAPNEALAARMNRLMDPIEAVAR